MYVFSKNNKSYTCPDSSLVAIAHIQATDRNVDKNTIYDDATATAYLNSLGFEVTQVPDLEPITKVPEMANWCDRRHRALYDKLFYHEMDRPLTEAENEFCKQMYHLEEYACGLG